MSFVNSVLRPLLITWAARSDTKAREAAAEAIVLFGGAADSIGDALGSTNHVWLVDSPPLAINVAAAERESTELAGRLVAARFLADLGVFTRLAAGREQPIDTRAGRLVTVWERVTVRDTDTDWHAVGVLLRRIGDAGVAGLADEAGGLPHVDDLTDVEQMIDQLAGSGRLHAADAALLLRVCTRLSVELQAHAAQGPESRKRRVVVHGDLWSPNVLTTSDGTLLCDADELGIGPSDWDLAALLDRGRPSATGRARSQVLAGWDTPAAMPSPERIRCLTRIAHLRRTLRLLGLHTLTPRDRYWNAVRLEGWKRIDQTWVYPAFPELHLSRQRQLQHLLGAAKAGARRIRSQ